MAEQSTTVSEIDHDGKRIKCDGSNSWVTMEKQELLKSRADGSELWVYMAGPTRDDDSGWIVGRYILPADEDKSPEETVH